MCNYYILLTFTTFSLFVLSCESSTNTEKEDQVKETLDDFYATLKSGEYANTEKFLDETLLNSGSKEEWIDLLALMDKAGTVESAVPISVAINTRKGITKALARYEVKRTKKPLFDELVLVEREDGFKISGYYYATKKDMLGMSDDAKKIAEEFYKDCKSNAYKKVTALMSERLKGNVSEEQLIAFLERKEKHGKLVSFENTGSKVKETNDGILCIMDYTVVHEDQTFYEDLVLLKKDGKFHIEDYEYFTNREKRHAHEEHGHTADETAEAFFMALEHEDPTELEPLLDKNAPAPDKWFEVIGNKQQTAGSLKKHFLLDSYHKTKDGNDYYVFDYHTEYEKKHLYEKLVLIKRGEEYKIMSYKYNEDKYEAFD